MKKKGLIISTIVMVVVLIASLTTATYAWFTNSGVASVTAIDFAVGASSDVLIGVSANNAYVAPQEGVVDPAAFYSDATERTVAAGNTVTWSGTTNGLGLSVNTGVNLGSMEKALYSFNTLTGTSGSYTAATMTTYNSTAPQTPATTFSASHGSQVTTGISHDTSNDKLLIGNGNGGTFDKTSLADAVVYTDYLDIAFGAAAGKANVLAYGCMVYIKPTNTKATLGLNAAIHVAYRLNGTGDWVDVDVYGANRYSTTKANMTAPTLPSISLNNITKTLTGATVSSPTAGDAYVWIPLYMGTYSNNAYSHADPSDIQQIQLFVYICGPDNDCVTAATGAGATIYIDFLSMNESTFTQA